MTVKIMDTNKTATASHAIDIESLGRARNEQHIDDEDITLTVENLDLYYDEKQALFDVNMRIPRQKVTAFIGPSGCGKSTLLRCFNRMNDLVDSCRVQGGIRLDGENIYDRAVDVATLRRRVGMVFQKPNPFSQVDL